MDGHDLYFEREMPIRFKAQAVKFHPVPTLPEQVGGNRERGGESRVRRHGNRQPAA